MTTRIGTIGPAALALLILLAPLRGQDGSGIPGRAEAERLYGEIVDLMDTSAVVSPELARAGAPLRENVKQGVELLQTGPSREHAGVVFSLLTNARVYLQLYDALPKPPNFSEDARRQIEQLRAKTDRIDQYFRALLDRREEEARGSDRDNLRRYSEDNSRTGPPGPNEKRVVFLGDSITDGWELNQFFPGKPFVNRGISGQITGQMLGRMQPDVIALQPAVMVLLGGTNDLARGVPVETIRYNITSIAELAAAHGIVPVLASILPVSDYHAETNPRFRQTGNRPPQRIVELNEWMKTLCGARNWIYLDYYTALADQRGHLAANLADDGLHPNMEGYKVMAPLAEQAIGRALAAQPTGDSRRRRFGVF